MNKILQVGAVTSTHGLAGEVKVFPTTDDPKRFKKLKQVLLDTGKDMLPLGVEHVKFFKNMVILKFKGYDRIEDIMGFKGKNLYVTRENAVKLQKDEYFIADMIGMRVVSTEGEELGKYIPVKKRITYQDLLRHNSINCSSVLLRRDVARKYPMEHEDSHEDYITWLKILQEYKTASGIDEPLLNYRLTSKGKSGNKLKSAGMTFKVYRYMGFGMGRSLCCFISYALNGIWKYR